MNVTVCEPSPNADDATTVTGPIAVQAAVPRATPSIYSVTWPPSSLHRRVNVGVVTFVMLSVSLMPLSELATRSGATVGVAGGVVSMTVKVKTVSSVWPWLLVTRTHTCTDPETAAALRDRLSVLPETLNRLSCADGVAHVKL